VDRDEIRGGGQRGRLQPELPDIGIGHGVIGAPANLLERRLDRLRRQFPPQKGFVADDQRLDRAGMAARETHGRLDLAAVLGAVAVQPDPLQHLEAVPFREPRNAALRAPRRIGADAARQLGKPGQILVDLPVGDAKIGVVGGLAVVERRVGHAR
jgi:hypothetical protein